MSQQKKGWGKKTVIAMYTSKDNLTPLLYSGKIKKKKKKKKSYSHQNIMVLAQTQKYKSVEQDRKPRNKPTHIW